MKKFVLFLSLFFSVFKMAYCDVPYQIPNEFTIKERFLSWTSDFDIETSTLKLGYVHRKFFSLRLQYDFYNTQDVLQASARMRWFTWGAEFDVTDSTGKALGVVNEKITFFFPTFEIISPEYQVIAIAKLNFWGTKYTLKDPVTEREMAVLSRPFFSLRDKWSVKISDPELFESKKIDPRLFITVMAFQTDKDNWRRVSAANARQMHVDEPKEDLAKIEALKEEVASLSVNLEVVEPTEEDFIAVDQLSEEILEEEINDDQSSEVEGIEKLLPLLEEDKLSEGQKSALLLLIDEKLRLIERN